MAPREGGYGSVYQRLLRVIALVVSLQAVAVACTKREETPTTAQATSTAPSLPAPPAIATGTAIATEVPVVPDGGTFTVPVSINDTIVLRFTIDSGASDVSIPADVVSTLFRAGTVTREDFLGTQTYVLADGTEMPSTQFRIRNLKVGTLVLHDVVGSVAPPKGSLLLGQSFLSRLASWSFDNRRQILALKAAPGQAELASTGPMEPAGSASSGEVGKLLSNEDILDVAADFDRTQSQSGFTGVIALVQDCYEALPAEETAAQRRSAAYCVTLDLLAQRVDAEFRQEFGKQTGKTPPPLEYFEDDVWRTRVLKYLPLTTATHDMPDASPVRSDVAAAYKAVSERMERRQARR